MNLAILARDNIGMMLIVVPQTFFLLWANLGLFVGFNSEFVVLNEVVEMVVGVTDGGMENELMIFLGSNLFFLNSPSHTKRKGQKYLQ